MPATNSSKPAIPFAEVQKRKLWVIHGQVYDLGPFLADHPGGSKVITKEMGKDATKAFSAIHSKDIIDRMLPKHLHLGPVEVASLPATELSAEELAVLDKRKRLPPLRSILNVFDFEVLLLQPQFLETPLLRGDDELTLQENRAAFHRIWLRPRVLVDVTQIDTRTTLLGQKSSLPIYMTATALARLADPQGEVALVKAAGKKGIIQMISTFASCSFDEMADAREPGQPQFFQLYVLKGSPSFG
eukprot:jgi/Hompol1/1309/HPOL_000534-RA